MGSRFVLSLGSAMALATALAPRAEAQVVARNPVTICRNGARIASEDSHACDRNGGTDLRATAIARHDEEVRAQARAQQTSGDDRYGRNDGTYNNGTNNNGTNNNGTYGRNDDDRYGRNDNGRWDDRDDRRGNGRGNGHGRWDNNGRWGNGRNGNAPREVYRWQGLVDKEVRIQLSNNRAYVQPVGNREVRNNNGQFLAGMPQQDGILRVQRIEGRGDIDVIQQPTAANGYSATLRVRDPSSGAANYRIVAVWEPANSNGRYGRN